MSTYATAVVNANKANISAVHAAQHTAITTTNIASYDSTFKATKSPTYETTNKATEQSAHKTTNKATE